MENRAHALMAGLFTLLLGFSSLAALWWFGGKPEATHQYQIITRKTISGLNVQAQVRYRGIRVGKVENIELDPSDVGNTLIRIALRKDIPVTRGTTARLGFQGVTGIAHVQLEDTGQDATPLEAGAGAGDLARIPMQDSLIQELSEIGGETLRNARDFLANANQVLTPENRLNISKTLSNLEVTSTNAREVSAQLRQLLTPENVRLLNSTLAQVEHTAAQGAPFLAEARGLVVRLQSMSDKLEMTLGDPLIGGAGALLPRLNQLSSELSSNSLQLNRVLKMLEESPQSLIFGRQKALPGPGEEGFIEPTNVREQP